jgi:hypothetical protein
MPLLVPKLGLAYFPVPKNACTSLKHLFYQINEGKPFVPYPMPSGGRLGYIHDLSGYGSLGFRPEFLEATEGHARLAVIRHPIRRLISAYKNRVLWHRELSAKALGAEVIAQTGLQPDPPFDLFIERLEEYRAASRSMRHHTAPQAEFLGPGLAAYEHVHKVEALPRLEALLGRLAGHPVTLPHDQQGGRDFPDPELSPETRRRLREACASDLEYLAAHYGQG